MEIAKQPIGPNPSRSQSLCGEVDRIVDMETKSDTDNGVVVNSDDDTEAPHFTCVLFQQLPTTN